MNRYVQQGKQLWESLTVTQRVSIVGVAAVFALGLFLIARHQSEQNFKPLFQNVSSEDAALILTRLRESGEAFRLADGGATIKVASEKIDELRIQLAADGLPKSGRIGFELFDKTNFGASEFAEQVNYHRAVEGELERSVLSLHEVEQARVHITFAKNSIFLERREPAKASVLVKLRPGVKLSPQNIQAITHLTASAVEGLTPERVSVLDMHGNLLNKPRREDPSGSEPSEALLAYRAYLEKELLSKIRELLDPLLGPERYRATVSVDCDPASGDQSEESFDPSRSVMTAAQRSEDGAVPATANGVPGTPSSLPRPTSRPSTAAGGAYRRTENTTFQTSRVVRRIQFPQGQVKRMSVSVLLDHSVRFEGQKKIVEAPPPQQLKSIREVVAAVVGFQESRGDVLTIETLPFSTSAQPEPPLSMPDRSRVALPEWLPAWLRAPFERQFESLLEQSWFPAAVVVFIVLMIASPVFLARRLMRLFSRKKQQGRDRAEMDPALTGSTPAIPIAPADENGRHRAQAQLTQESGERERKTREALEALRAGDVNRLDILRTFVTEEVKKEPEKMAQVVRAWLREPE